MKSCFLCGDIDSVIDFNEETFYNCFLKLLFRKEKHFLYSDVHLTRELVDDFGYHSCCYKKVTALNKKYVQDYKNFVRKHEHQQCTSTADEHPSTPDRNGHQSTSDTWKNENNPDPRKSIAEVLDSSCNTPDPTSPGQSDTVHEILKFSPDQVLPSVSASTSNTGTTCLFCNNSQKRSGQRRINVRFPTSRQTMQQIKKIASALNDIQLLAKLETQTIAYHPSCISAYQVLGKRQAAEHVDSSWHEDREVHKLAFDALKDFITNEIIDHQKIVYLSQLVARYKALLLEFGGSKLPPEHFANYRCEFLEKKIMKVFGDRLTVETSAGPHPKKLVYINDMDVSVLAHEAKVLQIKYDNKFEDVAYDLRNCVKNIESKKLPKRLAVNDVIQGECEIPEKLVEFMSNLIRGPNMHRDTSDNTSLIIKSLCSDIIYAVTKGRVKPAKNLTLGLAMKSLTNSRQVVTILNRHGHTIGYNLAEELETEMTYTAVQDNKIIPSGIDAADGRSTHVAFDNFDRFVDTTSGKDTMHDTVGIIYQFPRADNQDVGDIENAASSTLQCNDVNDKIGPTVRKRRRFNEIPRDVRPYYSKPTAGMELLHVDSIVNTIEMCKGAAKIAFEKDLLWIMSLSRINSVPMWLGYNCIIATDCSEIQSVDYLAPINSSPTSYAIVNETLVMASEIAEQCHEELIIATYDLAIAKMAMQIQQNERPKFDNIFINLGAFHTQMAFFKAIGKYIDSSGLIDILVQAEVLAGGSMNSFLDNKHFNRCKRLHPLTSAALQILHFEQYLSRIDSNPEMMDELLLAIMDTSPDQTSSNVNDRIELPELLLGIVEGYKGFCEKTLSGEHGKTAQYYFQYCYFINLFLRFSRSIRCSNFELYSDSLFEMSDLFFSLNQQNYARWSVMYLSNLIRLHIEDSPLVAEFRRGAFGIRRTKANFARSPVDLTLEQTINADASNQLTNNLSADSISARQRWALSHSMRTKILSAVKESIGLSQQDDTSYSLQSNRIKKDKKSLRSILETIKNTLNPFNDNCDKSVLFNISTGKAASSEVTNFLINVKSFGNEQKLKFISECCSVPGRFEKPIKRNKILNFASQCVVKAQVSKDKSKRALLKMERDLFGRLLAISVNKKINIEHCLAFPLAPVPPALSSCTGEMLKTDKSALAKQLKSNIEMIEPPRIDIEIIDGFYYLHLVGSSMPHTFDKVAESILIKLCSSSASEIHIIFDRYLTPSIKDCERQSRLEFEIPYRIEGPLQARPTDFLGSLKNKCFKEAVIQFLAYHWENDFLASIIGRKKIFLTVGEKCFSYHTDGNHVAKCEEVDYLCQHEESDTRMMFHIVKAPPGSAILVKATDTDVLVILLANMHKFPNFQIWLAGSTSKKGNNKDLNCINCTELSLKLGIDLCLGLPAFHAFTGCDYTAAFFNKGKARPFKIFSKNPTYQKIFASLTDEADIFNDEKIEVVQEFTALMYGIKHCASVNDARYSIFLNNYATKKDNEQLMKKIKSFDSTQIPPCWKSLKQKMLRTIYVNSMWLNATDPCCVKLRAEDCGWFMDNYLKPTWFIGDPTPLQVEDILSESNNENDDDNNTEFDYNIESSDESEAE